MIKGISRFAPPHGQDWAQWAKWASDMPLARQLNLRCTHIEAGRTRLVLDGVDWIRNPNGAAHGGIVIACADHLFGVVASTVLEDGVVPATATFTSDFLRPAHLPLTFEGVVERVGRTLAFVTVTVTDRDGKVCNQVRGTMVVDGNSRPAHRGNGADQTAQEYR